MHINNIYRDRELHQNPTCKESLQVQTEGGRKIKRKVRLYNLDIIIAVGYRVNSVLGTSFRIWSTKILNEHITRGYTINPNQISKNYSAFMKTVEEIQNLLPEHTNIDPKAVLDLVKEFSSTWMSLEAYDKESLSNVGTTKKAVRLTGEELKSAIYNLKNDCACCANA